MNSKAVFLLWMSAWTLLISPFAPLLAYGGLFIEDKIPPKIVHQAIEEIPVDGKPFEITAIMTDNEGVRKGLLFYRSAMGIAFIEIKMEAMEDNMYRAVIPSEDISSPGSALEYYIAAIDNVGNVTLQGLLNNPMIAVVKAMPIPPVEVPDLAPIKEVMPEVKMAPVPLLDGLTVQTKPDEPVITPFYKKGWFWGLVAILVGGIILVGTDDDHDGPNTGSLVVEIPVP